MKRLLIRRNGICYYCKLHIEYFYFSDEQPPSKPRCHLCGGGHAGFKYCSTRDNEIHRALKDGVPWKWHWKKRFGKSGGVGNGRAHRVSFWITPKECSVVESTARKHGATFSVYVARKIREHKV